LIRWIVCAEQLKRRAISNFGIDVVSRM
jgi:hypothetical protein